MGPGKAEGGVLLSHRSHQGSVLSSRGIFFGGKTIIKSFTSI